MDIHEDDNGQKDTISRNWPRCLLTEKKEKKNIDEDY